MSKKRTYLSLRLGKIAEEKFSPMFDDIFFHPTRYLEEVNYNFIDGNRLIERWHQHDWLRKPHFTIGELGFGTGLNCLVTLQHWLNIKIFEKYPHAHLQFLTTEKHPLSQASLTSIYQNWRKHFEFSELFLQHYPQLTPGPHYRRIDKLHSSIYFLLGDAFTELSLFSGQHFAVDAWYLDGFAPSKNSEMWSHALIQKIASLTASNGTFSTFTAAGHVRRNLEAAGFDVKKRKGFGKKREMLIGQLSTSSPAHQSQKSKIIKPWFPKSSLKSVTNTGRKPSAAIIGAGIAGSSLAYSLCRRGWQVKLIDSGSEPGNGASGNPAALVYPTISADINLATQLYLIAFDYCSHEYQSLCKKNISYKKGVLFVSDNEKRKQRILQIGFPENLVRALSTEESLNACGFDTCHSSLYFQEGLTIQPHSVINAYLDKAQSLKRYFGSHVESISQTGNHWYITTNNSLQNSKQDFSADCVILCTGASLELINTFSEFPLTVVKGQITSFPAMESHLNLKKALCGNGYLLPEINQLLCLGASYEPQFDSAAIDFDARERNLDKVEQLSQTLHGLIKTNLSQTSIKDRVSFRNTTLDHLPCIGAFSPSKPFKETFFDIKKGKHANQYPTAPTYKNLFLHTGFGSKGFLTAPLLSEHLACELNGEPSPLTHEIAEAIHPNRFYLRKLQRQ